MKMSIIPALAFSIILFAACAAEFENLTNLPKIQGFKVKEVYRLNQKLLASYTDSVGNSLMFKFHESSATWRRIIFKTKDSFGYDG